MRVLVTGGTGFLGTALVTRLVDLGHQVRVLIRATSDVSVLPPGVELAVGNVTARDSLAAAADGVECIVHMAALVQSWARDPKEFDREHRGFGFCSDYERTKYLADKLVLRAAMEEGLDVRLVYPGVIYGPGKVSTSNLLVKIIVDHFQGRLPGVIGSGRSLSCLVHVNDVVTGMLLALERGRPGRRYILGGENVSILGVFKLVQDYTGRAPPQLRIPIWVAKIIGFCAVVVARLGGPVPIFTHKTVEAFAHDWAYSSALAHKDFGYSPLLLRDGLKETLEWLRGNGFISF